MRHNQNEEQRIFEVSNPFKDKYEGKPIRFLDKNDHYELIWISGFQSPDENCTIYNDLLVDLKEANKSKEIHVWVNSLGGDTTSLVMISQLLEQFEYIVTIGTGEIDSAGFDLWAVGDQRYLFKNSLCMYHGLSTFAGGKSKQLKNYSQFIESYSKQLEDYIKAKNILTDEEIEKGRLTQVWILGSQLINRGVAIDFSLYKNRQSMAKIQGFKMDQSFYVKDVQGKYYQCMIINDGLQKREIMRNYINNMRESEKTITNIVQKLGEEFVQFVQCWIKMKGRILDSDGFISNDDLYLSYCGMCQPIKLQEIKEKLKQWCQFVSLEFIDNISKKGVVGFVIRLKEEKVEDVKTDENKKSKKQKEEKNDVTKENKQKKKQKKGTKKKK